MKITTGRPATLAPNGMVTSPHALASAAGQAVLKAGGSAIDAAIATSAALSVLYPHMTGVGGDAFWLIYDAKTKEVRYLNGGGRAAANSTLDFFNAKGLSEIPFRGILPATVTTPGSVDSWCTAHEAYGKLSLRENLQTAIDYARHGFPVTERLSNWINKTQADLKLEPHTADIFLKDGVPKPGSILKNPNLAQTLDAIAEHGRDGFYGRAVGQELATFSRERGGLFTAQDLEQQRSTWGAPLVGRYHDLTLYQTPPPTQGFTVIEMLNLLEPLNLKNTEYLGPDHVHAMVQSKQIAYHDRDRFLADPNFAKVPTERLISKSYADERRALMDPQRALPWDKVPSYGSLTGDTVYIAVVDAQGNAVSLIHSLYGLFGSCVVAGNTGVVLQNRGAYFSLDPTHANKLEPGKIPLHTLIASIGIRNDKLWSVLGCMGADGQPQIQLQAYVAMMDFGCDIQQALEAPRWLSGRFALGEPRDTLHMEDRFSAQTVAELERRGHRLNKWAAYEELAGHAHGITIDPDSGVRAGGSDPRSDGAAIGY